MPCGIARRAFTMSFMHAELTLMIARTRETVTRTLSPSHKEKLISMQRFVLKVLQPVALDRRGLLS